MWLQEKDALLALPLSAFKEAFDALVDQEGLLDVRKVHIPVGSHKSLAVIVMIVGAPRGDRATS
jgi:hypothetical protein